jgi:thioredoxin reductase (NADPH)
MSDTEAARVLIIGGGPAGYTAAIYAARAGLAPVCIEGYSSGGQIIRSPRIDNYPGYPDGVNGSELADRMRAQAQAFGARIVMSDVESVDLDGPPFMAVTAERRYTGESLIIATGAEPRQLGLPSEIEFEGRGVCYCAICDGAFFAGRRVAVVGGGNAAVEDALALSATAKSVILVHRRKEFRASATVLNTLAQSPVKVLSPHVITEILGDDTGVTGIRVRDLDSGTPSDLEIDGIFIAIGHDPSSGMFAPWLKIDERGYLITEAGSTATNVAGVFAAGDVADSRFRQAITAAATGCQAAIESERWLISRGAVRPATPTDAGPRAELWDRA